MNAIFKKEFRSYFHNMIGPVFMAVLLFFMGIYFIVYNIYNGYPYFAISLSGVSVVFLFLVPILTMRSFAEEKRTKTDQMLLTSRLSVTQIVLGKFFAMDAIFGICMLAACIGPLAMKLYGGGALLPDYLAILMFFLLGSAYISIGMFLSSLTESQVLAAVGTFAVLLVLQLVDGLAGMVSSSSLLSLIVLLILVVLVALLIYGMTKNVFLADGIGMIGAIALIIVYAIKKSLFEGIVADLLGAISLAKRFDTVLEQILDPAVIVLYISVTALFVFLTVQAVQKRRWS